MQTRTQSGCGRTASVRREGRGEQLALQRRVVQFGRHRPGDADHGGAAQILGNRVPADPDHRSNLVAALAADMLDPT